MIYLVSLLVIVAMILYVMNDYEMHKRRTDARFQKRGIDKASKAD